MSVLTGKSGPRVAAILAFAAGGCGGEPEPVTTAPSAAHHWSGVGTMALEEELFGDIYVGGSRVGGGYSITLQPDPLTNGRLLPPPAVGAFAGTMTSQAAGHSFGWWEPASTDGGCSDAATSGMSGTEAEIRTALVEAYLNQNNRTRSTTDPGNFESHTGWPATLEPHCVRPGQYTLSISGTSGSRSLVVEYLAAEANPAGGAPVLVLRNPPVQGRTGEFVDADAYQTYDAVHDLVVHTDFQAAARQPDVPVLEIENHGSTRIAPYGTAETFTATSTPQGTGSTWFRFSVIGSTINAPHGALARLFYDYGVFDTARTQYYDPFNGGLGLLRTHQFQGHVPAPRCVSVGLELLGSDEAPIVVNDPTEIDLIRQVGIGKACPVSQADPAPVRVTLSTTQARPGQSINFVVRTQNQGGVAVTGGWSGQAYLSTDNVYSGGDVALGATYQDPATISAGSFNDLGLSRAAPGVTAGNYYLIAKGPVGPDGSTANDTWSSTTTLAILPPAPPVACWTGILTTWKVSDQVLNGGCSTPASGLQYRWQTDAGGPWTAYSTSPLYDFPGHPGSGNKSVTLEVRDPSTGLTGTQTRTIVVQNSQLTFTGPRTVTDKLTKTYTATVASQWYEILPPSTTWQFSNGSGFMLSLSRAWPQGCYSAQLRADASSTNPVVLKRARATITVASASGGCGAN